MSQGGARPRPAQNKKDNPSDCPSSPHSQRVSIGGRYKDRTCDPYHVKVVLYR